MHFDGLTSRLTWSDLLCSFCLFSICFSLCHFSCFILMTKLTCVNIRMLVKSPHICISVYDACVEERRLNGMLRRLADDERPLQLCLRWADDGADSLNRRHFVLQDNVTSEIAVSLITSVGLTVKNWVA